MSYSQDSRNSDQKPDETPDKKLKTNNDAGSQDVAAKPLSGIKVIDLSRFLPASFCSMILADFGADVIRVEQPREVAKQNKIFGRDQLSNEQQTYYKEQEILARNKRAVSMDLRTEAAKITLAKMLNASDILIHDYRLVNAVAMQLDYENIHKKYPSLIHVGVSLCGQTGPYQDLAGHDPIALALSGALSRFGIDTASTDTFAIPGLPIGDLSAGLQAVIGILMALRARDVSGLGQSVDVSMFDCALMMMTSVMQRFLMDGVPPPQEWKGANIGLWKTADGKILCTTDLEPAYWQKFCQAVSRPDLISLQFSDVEAEYRDNELQKIFQQRTRDQWFEFLRGVGTQVAPAYSLQEALEDPHAQARGTVFTMHASNGRSVTQIGSGVKLSATPATVRHLGRLAGHDNKTVLREFGLTDSEIEMLS